jgi:hypothetical protein
MSEKCVLVSFNAAISEGLNWQELSESGKQKTRERRAKEVRESRKRRKERRGKKSGKRYKKQQQQCKGERGRDINTLSRDQW